MAFVSLILAATAAAPAAPAAAAPPSPRWDHPGYDAEDSYYNPHETAVVASSIGRLAKKWSVALRHPTETCIGTGPPVVRDGRVFVSDGLGVSAYSAKTGALHWRFTVVDPVDTTAPTLAVDGGMLLVGTSSCRPSGSSQELTALDVGTGRLRWKKSQGQPLGAMVVDKGVAVVSGYSDIFDDAQATAYRISDGRVLWTKPGSVAANVSADGVVLIRKIGDDGEATTAVTIGTGVARWTRTGNWLAQAAGPAADRFYVIGAGSKLAALNVADGKVLWTRAIDAGGRGDLLAIDGNRVYRADTGTVEALDPSNGKRLWTAETTGDPHQPVVAGGLVYTGGTVLNAVNGKPAGPSLSGYVIVTGARLYRVVDDKLSAYAP
jgi:outer membrane protein assembly factor BamB